MRPQDFPYSEHIVASRYEDELMIDFTGTSLITVLGILILDEYIDNDAMLVGPFDAYRRSLTTQLILADQKRPLTAVASSRYHPTYNRASCTNSMQCPSRLNLEMTYYRSLEHLYRPVNACNLQPTFMNSSDPRPPPV